jgi:hypothetical protein
MSKETLPAEHVLCYFVEFMETEKLDVFSGHGLVGCTFGGGQGGWNAEKMGFLSWF